MRVILKEEYLKVPDDGKCHRLANEASFLRRFELWILTVSRVVEVSIKARKISVKGPRGEITKDLSHVQADITVMEMSTKKLKGKHVRVAIWNGQYRRICAVKTLIGLINNMFVGVTEVSTYYTLAVLRAPFIARKNFRPSCLKAD